MDWAMGLFWGTQFQNLHINCIWKPFTHFVRGSVGAFGAAENSDFVKDIFTKWEILRYPKEGVQKEA